MLHVESNRPHDRRQTPWMSAADATAACSTAAKKLSAAEGISTTPWGRPPMRLNPSLLLSADRKAQKPRLGPKTVSQNESAAPVDFTIASL